ncbi:MAG: CbtA family protein [Nocardioidaceae bacterium]
MNARTFLVRGLLAGLVAGLVAFALASFIGEPSIRTSIAIEESAGGAAHPHGPETSGHSHDAEETVVSRQDQSTWGLLTATVVLGTALGGIVALASAAAVGRLGRLRPGASTVVVTLLGFVAFCVVPYAKYPPNPPAVGEASTIGARTAGYFGYTALAILGVVLAVVAARRLASRWSVFPAVVLPVVGFVVAMTALGFALPPGDQIPSSFPAETLWEFRTASFVVQAGLWAVLAVVLGGSIDKADRDLTVRRERRDLIAAP